MSLGRGWLWSQLRQLKRGVDISARTLITELAPWPSMVQRVGRCNREGKYEDGGVFWVDVGERKQDTAPYDLEDVAHARIQMKKIEGRSIGPADIESMGDAIEEIDHDAVIRKRDVIGLFDTTPDLSGSYLDVSQYVRGGEEREVLVFWRDISETGPDKDAKKAQRSETVSIPLGKNIADYMKDSRRKLWIWDFLDDQWRQIQHWQIRPGMTLMLNAAYGGYSPDTGWGVSIKTPVEVLGEDAVGEAEDGQNSDPNSTGQRTWVSLSGHSHHVEAEVNAILNSVSGWLTNPEVREAVALAALFHDVGKAHYVFQEMLRKSLPEKESPPAPDVLMAKSPGKGKHSRPYFRHELGSALAVLAQPTNLTGRSQSLAAYLAASHHGKVRLGIRSMPGRRRNNTESNPDPKYLLGYPIDKAEMLPSVDLGGGVRSYEVALDMSIAQVGAKEDGQRSWLDRTLGLLEWLGPFRLAYLEAITRAADMRASKKEVEISE